MGIEDILITARRANLKGVMVSTGVTPPLPKSKSKSKSKGMGAIEPQRWTLEIPGWMPVPLNKLTGRHWGPGHRRKKHDKEVIALAVALCGIPPATRRRRVSLTVVLGKGDRSPDPDALHKSLRDALVACGALKNDSTKWVEGDDPRFARGRELVSFVTLENV